LISKWFRKSSLLSSSGKNNKFVISSINDELYVSNPGQLEKYISN
jgi:hypothetical protein